MAPDAALDKRHLYATEQELLDKLAIVHRGELAAQGLSALGRLNIADAHYGLLIYLSRCLEYLMQVYGYPTQVPGRPAILPRQGVRSTATKAQRRAARHDKRRAAPHQESLTHEQEDDDDDD